MSTITHWLLSAAAFVAVGTAIVWGWLQHRKSAAKDGAFVTQAEELGKLQSAVQADRVTDAGAAAEARVKEADAKAEKEVQDVVARPGGLVGYLKSLRKP